MNRRVMEGLVLLLGGSLVTLTLTLIVYFMMVQEDNMKTRKEVTFQEAYKAVYDGKTIQSGLTGNKYISSIVVWNRDEVKVKWYILDQEGLYV